MLQRSKIAKKLDEKSVGKPECVTEEQLFVAACCANNIDIVKRILESGVDVNSPDMKESVTGSSPLYLAVANSCKEILMLLLDAGFDINAVNYAGETALIRSILNKNDDIAGLLVDSGADVNKIDKMKRTPLIVAAQEDCAKIAMKLIEAGAILDGKDINGNTAFLVAAENDSTSFLKYFFGTQAVSREEHLKAVIKASMSGFVDSTSMLLENSPDEERQNELVLAAITSACIKDKPELVHICMDFDCEIDSPIFFGMTPLMIACYSNAQKTADQLIAYGADVNKADDDGTTALMYSACKNAPLLIQLLLKNGADKTARDKNGKTFEDYTLEYDARSFKQMVFERARANIKEMEREDDIPPVHQSFCERFDWYIQKYMERTPDFKYSDIYKAAGLSKQNWSKIISKVSGGKNPDFRPQKETVISLALGLRLTLSETTSCRAPATHSWKKTKQM